MEDFYDYIGLVKTQVKKLCRRTKKYPPSDAVYSSQMLEIEQMFDVGITINKAAQNILERFCVEKEKVK